MARLLLKYLLITNWIDVNKVDTKREDTDCRQSPFWC